MLGNNRRKTTIPYHSSERIEEIVAKASAGKSMAFAGWIRTTLITLTEGIQREERERIYAKLVEVGQLKALYKAFGERNIKKALHPTHH